MRGWLSFLWVFLRIGLTGFGGPFALVALLEKAAVEDKKWLTRAEFAECLGIGSLTPGPLASGVVASVGYRMRGAVGATLAYIVYHLPSLILVVVLTSYLGTMRSVPVLNGALRGIGAAVVGLLAGVAYKTGQAQLKSPRTWALAGIATAAFLAQPRLALLILLACAAVGAWLLLPDVTPAKQGGK